MSCINNGSDGICTQWDEENDKGTTYEDCEGGWDLDGSCVCEDDPDPLYSCAHYENTFPEED